MSITPNRDAIDAAAAESRRRHADDLARDDAIGIGRRMGIEGGHAILGGVADLLDRGVAGGLVWPHFGAAVANTVSAFLMTVANGDPERAEALLPGAIASIEELARAHLRRPHEAWSVGTPEPSHPAGRA